MVDAAPGGKMGGMNERPESGGGGMEGNQGAGAGPAVTGGEPVTTRRTSRRLTRRLDQRVVAGVAAGLGEYFELDPVLFRVGFVVATFLGGAGILIYVLAWWLIPASAMSPESASQWHEPLSERVLRAFRLPPGWIGILILVVGAAILASQLGVWRPDVVWGLALIGLGGLLFRRATEEPTAESPTVPRTGPASEAGTEASVIPVASPRRVAARRQRRRERSPLGWITLGAILLVVGVVATLDNANVFHLAIDQFLALALAILGIGLLVGAWWGRARWLIFIGILLVPFVLVATLIDVPLTGGFGGRFYRPRVTQDLKPTYRLTAGQMVLDLRSLEPGSGPVALDATAVAGLIRIYIPSDALVHIRARTGAGDVLLLRQHFDGLKVDVVRTIGPVAASREIDLDIETSFGQVVVQQ
jgi:phage shock protein PspC (stress-responsive transcriptional regulator)